MDRIDVRGADVSNDPKGLKELKKALRKLPQNIQKNVMTGAVRAGAKPIVKRAKELVPVDSGDLKSSIKVKKRRTKNKNQMRFTIHAGGKISKTEKKTVKKRGIINRALGKTKEIDVRLHPYYVHIVEWGTSTHQAHPFMRPALEQEAKNAIIFVRKYMEIRIPKEIAKAKK